MTKRWLTLVGIAVLIPALYAGTVFAGSQIKLLINYKETKTEVPLQLKNGTVIGSVKQIADVLGANTEWDAKNNSIGIVDAQKIRAEQLERAVAPNNKLSAATLYAEAAKTRNGALRYALLSPELRKKQYQEYKELNWVLGVSSPWVESYKIKEVKSTGNSYAYEINYVLTDSSKTKYSAKESVTIGKTHLDGSDKWLVTKSDKPSWDVPQMTKSN